ncbi:hypothetical protein [Aliivibrio logei]|uniref:hypothetical protein n=1 Tax=Aliivibrio logei TaxID=688 RepID=UPI0035C908D0
MRRAHTSLLLLLMLFVTSFPLYAKEEALPTMQELLNNHQITLTSFLSSENASSDKKRPTIIAINQPVILTIDIATPRWFTDGTVIETISIPNLIAQQRNLQATNYSQMEGGQTWSHQRWEIPLFPQQTGQFIVPSIGIKITVSVATGKNIQGVLFTQPHRFSAQRPTVKMTAPEEWVVSSDAILTQTWEILTSKITTKESAKPIFTVGDTVTRQVSLQASNSLAILLPTLIPIQQDKAVLTYTNPVQLKDMNNRGEHTALRKESETYILQNGGKITLPSIIMPYWNTTTQQSETLLLKGKTIQVKHSLVSWLKAYWALLALALTIIVFFVFLIKKITNYYQTNPYPDWLLFFQATKCHSSPEIRLYLYRKVFKKTELLELKKYQINNQETWNSDSENVQKTMLSPRKLWRLWFKIK